MNTDFQTVFYSEGHNCSCHKHMILKSPSTFLNLEWVTSPGMHRHCAKQPFVKSLMYGEYNTEKTHTFPNHN